MGRTQMWIGGTEGGFVINIGGVEGSKDLRELFGNLKRNCRG